MTDHTSSTIALASAADAAALAPDFTSPSGPPRRGLLKAFSKNPATVLGLAILLLVVAVAVSASLVYPGDPQDIVGPALLWPGEDASFLLGTDSLGRDVAAGVMYGARVSLTTGAVAAAISLTIGLLIGALSGYFGGWIDDVLVRLTELVQTVPTFLFIIVVVTIARPSAPMIIFAIGAACWPVTARLVRAEFRTLRESEYVIAARSQGFGNAWIIFREILPNALPPVIVSTSVLVANAILIESGLSFLGLGDPNAMSWGSMIGEGREMLRTAWYLSAVPGVAIVLTILALNLVGDAINDTYNPRLVGRT